jgi:hypothetical protein
VITGQILSGGHWDTAFKFTGKDYTIPVLNALWYGVINLDLENYKVNILDWLLGKFYTLNLPIGLDITAEPLATEFGLLVAVPGEIRLYNYTTFTVMGSLSGVGTTTSIFNALGSEIYYGWQASTRTLISVYITSTTCILHIESL